MPAQRRGICRQPMRLPSAFCRAPAVCYFFPQGLATEMRNRVSLFSIITFALLVSARADLTIVQRVEGAGQNGDVTVKIKGEKERIDAPSQPTRIIDGKTGE